MWCIQKMEYYLAIKSDTCYYVDKPWKHYAKLKKADAKGHIFLDSIYMKFPEYTNL